MMKHFILFVFLVCPAGLLAQELCDNGIDDDGDGWIDLNDPDCNCLDIESDSIGSLFPNPSFEDRTCCPFNFSQMHCAESWVQASDATSDYFNTCGYTHIPNYPLPPFPLPGFGSGYVGFYSNFYTDNSASYQEYVGACLNALMPAGQGYHARFFLSRGLGSDTLIVSIYGTQDCSDLPWIGEDCPIGNGSWIELGRDTIILDSNIWNEVNIEFMTPMDIHAVAIGGTCHLNIGRNYYYADGLTLASVLAFSDGVIIESGNWCNHDLQLRARINEVGGSWQWYRDGIALPGEIADSLNLITYGMDAVYTAVYTLNGACARIDHVVDTTDIGNRPLELHILNQDTLVCEGTVFSIRAAGTPGAQYEWFPTLGVSDPTVLNPDITAIGDTPVLYTLTASIPGCPQDSSQSILVEVDHQYLVSYKAEPRQVCVGQPVYLYPTLVSGVKSLSWGLPHQNPVKQSKQFVYQRVFEDAGVYPLTLYSSFRACPDTSYTDSIIVYPLPEVDLGKDSSICLQGHPIYLKNLRDTPLSSYHQVWSTGDTTEILKVVHPGIYKLSVTTEPIGCTTTESITIAKDCYVDIPNAFTPDGDGHNDYFLPRQLLSASLSRFKLQVFNRWGQLVFETTNLNGRGWDGRLNGQAQPMGVYLYRIEADFSNGRQETYEGNVTLLR